MWISTYLEEHPTVHASPITWFSPRKLVYQIQLSHLCSLPLGIQINRISDCNTILDWQLRIRRDCGEGAGRNKNRTIVNTRHRVWKLWFYEILFQLQDRIRKEAGERFWKFVDEDQKCDQVPKTKYVQLNINQRTNNSQFATAWNIALASSNESESSPSWISLKDKPRAGAIEHRNKGSGADSGKASWQCSSFGNRKETVTFSSGSHFPSWRVIAWRTPIRMSDNFCSSGNLWPPSKKGSH
jgi:hypothetical protein